MRKTTLLMLPHVLLFFSVCPFPVVPPFALLPPSSLSLFFLFILNTGQLFFVVFALLRGQRHAFVRSSFGATLWFSFAFAEVNNLVNLCGARGLGSFPLSASSFTLVSTRGRSMAVVSCFPFVLLISFAST